MSLTRSDLREDVVSLAPRLLGCVITRATSSGVVSVRLTEVEAYLGEGLDPGSHAHRGMTPRTRTMFGPPGHLYVYFTYGMHHCANLVCGPEGTASAVLLRAGEVVAGVDLARSRRPAAKRDVDLARGPARLASCLDLGRSDDGVDAFGPEVSLTDRTSAPASVSVGPRVGLRLAAEAPLRFWIPGEPTVSAYRPAVPRGRRRPSGETLYADRDLPPPGRKPAP